MLMILGGRIMIQQNINSIFFYASFILLAVGLIAALFIAGFEMRQQKTAGVKI